MPGDSTPPPQRVNAQASAWVHVLTSSFFFAVRTKESNTCACYCANARICARLTPDHDLVCVIPFEKREKEKIEKDCPIFVADFFWGIYNQHFSVKSRLARLPPLNSNHDVADVVSRAASVEKDQTMVQQLKDETVGQAVRFAFWAKLLLWSSN